MNSHSIDNRPTFTKDDELRIAMGAVDESEMIGAARSVRFKQLESKLLKQVGSASADYAMVQEADKILVCLSGGKDSYSLLSLLLEIQKRAPFSFELVALNVDQKQPNFPEHVLPNYLTKLGVPYRIVQQDTYSIVKAKIPEGQTTCSLCSRLRRGIIYRAASEMGATKIALGHHREDIVETLFLNMFFGGTLKAMPPKLFSDSGEHTIIRPLAYCAEADLARYALYQKYPIIPCDLCGSQENLQRKKIKEMLREWELQYPGRTSNLLSATRNVVASQLADTRLYDFKIGSQDSSDQDTAAPQMGGQQLWPVKFVNLDTQSDQGET